MLSSLWIALIWALLDGLYVGYQQGSFIRNLLLGKGLLESKLVAFNASQEMYDLLSYGVVAAVLAHPSFSASTGCNELVLVPAFNLQAAAFGFAFPLGYPGVRDMPNEKDSGKDNCPLESTNHGQLDSNLVQPLAHEMMKLMKMEGNVQHQQLDGVHSFAHFADSEYLGSSHQIIPDTSASSFSSSHSSSIHGSPSSPTHHSHIPAADATAQSSSIPSPPALRRGSAQGGIVTVVNGIPVLELFFVQGEW
ncbi:hypothetical protein Cgig2_016781 [Carnegiea gigantea]|uniref:Uncharacterized protein n=1 Tax=Carnegiea gigantea TaxID=171969 RepID=A0A9Q1GPZ8_9CARY|nr:hypothetical protein Cgig2_016781 [Carnegiea gigantea]